MSVSPTDEVYLPSDDAVDCMENIVDIVKLLNYLGFTVHPENSSLTHL